MQFKVIFLIELTMFCTNATTDEKTKGNITENTAVESAISKSKQKGISKLPECNFTVWPPSIQNFRKGLEIMYPNFVIFKIKWNHSVVDSSSLPHAVLPDRWVWTYSDSKLWFPYINWNIDYGVLSFGLLDAKTIDLKYVLLESSSSCSMTLGTNATSTKIASALATLTSFEHKKYENNYFCYLAEAEGMKDTLEYLAGLYLNYPTAMVSYNCCTVRYSYTRNKFVTSGIEQFEKWTMCLLGPYILSILLFLFVFPIFSLKIAASLSENEPVMPDDENDRLLESQSPFVETDCFPNWIFLTNTSPLTFFGVLKTCCLCGSNHFPVLRSRLRRCVCVLLSPCVVYIQLLMYSKGMGFGQHSVTVPDLLEHGTPMGLLSLLSQRETYTFVPALGGPFVIIATYYTLGLIFFVLPRSVKQIVENGMPMSRPCSSLFFGVGDIIFLSGLNINPSNGYEKGEAVCKCSFYMLFTKQFWLKLFDIQMRRVEYIVSLKLKGLCKLVKPVLLLLLICICIIESLASLIFYGIPFFGFVSLFVKGASKSLMNLRLYYGLLGRIFQNPVCIFIASVCIFVLYICFAYACCLIFIDSFSFICKICMFCFVAVVVYPSVSFGFLFFFVAIIYYLVHLVLCFGDEYLVLLTLAVEISVEQETVVNQVIIRENELIVSNVAAHGINRVRINDILFTLKDYRPCFLTKPTGQIKTKRNGTLIGIRRELFEYLVRKYRPVHQQFLKVVLKLGLIITFIFVTISITSKSVSKASSEVSEVMYVIFLVSVGAFPRVFEIALMSQNELVKKDILRRGLELSIEKFWVYKANDA